MEGKNGQNPMKKDIENFFNKSSFTKKVASFGGHSSKSSKHYSVEELKEAIKKSKSK